MEPEETAAAGQQLDKHIPAVTNALETTVGRRVFMRFVSYQILNM
jgi:hypothetical protein